MHIHGTAFPDEFLTPDFMHQSFPIKYLSGVLQKQPQDGKFLFGQFHIFTQYTNLVVLYIHGDAVGR